MGWKRVYRRDVPGNGKVALVGIAGRRSQVISSMEFSFSKHSVPVAAVKLPSPKLNPIEMFVFLYQLDQVSMSQVEMIGLKSSSISPTQGVVVARHDLGRSRCPPVAQTIPSEHFCALTRRPGNASLLACEKSYVSSYSSALVSQDCRHVS